MLRFDDTSSDDQLAKLHQKEEEEFLQIMADKHGIPYADLSSVAVDTNAVGLLKEDVARAALIAPFEITNKKLKVGIFSPTQPNTKEVLASLVERGYSLEQYLVSHASLETVWERYREISGATKSEAGMVDISGENMEGLLKKFNSLSDVSKALEATVEEKSARHISNLFSVVIAGAIGIRASDIRANGNLSSLF
jgi:type II secretory ATPase GspE/PulE/Tfp pilus assembly ATPase PilB-like protein